MRAIGLTMYDLWPDDNTPGVKAAFREQLSRRDALLLLRGAGYRLALGASDLLADKQFAPEDVKTLEMASREVRRAMKTLGI